MDAEKLAKRKKINKVTLKVFGVILLVIASISIFSPDSETAVAKTATGAAPESDSAIRQKKLDAAFSGWDGSHRNLVKYVKQNMNDPDSFDHVETRYWNWRNDSVVIKMKFRGKNAFGGVVLQHVRAVADLNGTLGTVDFDE